MLAEACTREVSCSFVLGVPPGQREPMAMSYWVAQSKHVALLPSELLERKHGLWQSQVAGLEQLPDFNLPYLDGSLPDSQPLCADRLRRPRSNIYCISVRQGKIDILIPLISRAIKTLPNPQCRIDFQHIGGAVQDQPMASSLYRGREAEWSIVVTSVWDPGDVMGEKTARKGSCTTGVHQQPPCSAGRNGTTEYVKSASVLESLHGIKRVSVQSMASRS